MSKAFTGDHEVNDILCDYEPREQPLRLKDFSDPVATFQMRP